MADIEKVTDWLNEIVNMLGSSTDESEQEVCQLANDTLELLKEQQEQKCGKWITHRTQEHDGEWYCDQCGYEPTVFEATPYCPNCGAMMY